MFKRKILAITLVATTLTAGATFNTGCAGKHKLQIPFSELQGAAQRTRDIYAPNIIRMIDGLLTMPEIKANAEAVDLLNRARPIAVKFKTNSVPLAKFLASVGTIDLTNKDEARAKLSDAQAAWDELTPLLNEINAKIAAKYVTNEWVRLGIEVAPNAISLGLSIVQSRIPE